jgi:hypothetical protein
MDDPPAVSSTHLTFIERRTKQVQRWWRKFFVEEAYIPNDVRKTCERYGEQVISAMLAGNHAPLSPDLQDLTNPASLEHARAWLTEESSYNARREHWISLRDFILEAFIVGLILWEIHMGYRQEGQQSTNFTTQQGIQKENFDAQQKVLKDLLSSSGSTAGILSTIDGDLGKQGTILENLKKSSSSTAATLSRQLNDFEAASRATLAVKTSPTWPNTQVAPDTPNSDISIACTIENGGSTAATSIRIERPYRLGSTPVFRTPKRIGSFTDPIEIDTKPNPDDAGPSLLSHATPMDCSWTYKSPPSDNVRSGGKSLALITKISYRDVFQHDWAVTDCKIYQPKLQAFDACRTKP